MMKAKLFLLFGLLLCVCAFGDPRVCYARIPLTRNPPVVDGIVNAEEWADAARLPEYSFSDAHLGDQHTETYVKYDAENLYVGFVARMEFEPDLKPLAHDDTGMTNVDAFSLNFHPDDSTLSRQFMVERAGGTMDDLFNLQGGDRNFTWEPRWQAQCHITPGEFLASSRWEAEVVIPWKSIDVKEAKTGLVLPTQFVHYHGNALNYSGERVFTWTPYTAVWGLFGYGGDLELGGDLPVFRFDRYAPMNRGFAGVQGVLTAPAQKADLGLIWGKDAPPRLQRHWMLPGTAVSCQAPTGVEATAKDWMTWIIQDAHGVIAQAGCNVTISPAFLVNIAPNRYDGEAVFLGDLAELPVPPKGSFLRFRLLDAAGKIVREQRLAWPSQPHFEVRLPLFEAPEGASIQAVAEVVDPQGKTLAVARQSFPALKRPAWLDNQAGHFERPLAATGWKEVTLSQDDQQHARFGILDHEYAFGIEGPLPQRLSLHEKAFAAAPFDFLVETAPGQKQVFTGDGFEVTNHDGRGATVHWKGHSSDLALQAEIRVEFDGLAWCRLQCTSRMAPGKPITLTKASIVMPLRPERLRYLRGMGWAQGIFLALISEARTSRPIPPIAIPYPWMLSGNGWTYQAYPCSSYWIGDDAAGMFVLLPRPTGPELQGNATEAVEATGPNAPYQFEIRLVDTRTTYDAGSAQFEFGFLITPSKTMKNRSRARRSGCSYLDHFTTDGKGTFTLPDSIFDDTYFDINVRHRFFGQNHLEPFTPGSLSARFLQPSPDIQVGNPQPDEKGLASIRDNAAVIRAKHGADPMLWYDSLFTPILLPTAINYLEDWECAPTRRYQVEFFGGMVCPTPAWQNNYLTGLQNFLKQGVNSVYMDMSGILPCQNRFHHHGWYDRQGKVRPQIDFLAYREFFLRMQQLVKSNDPNGLVEMHSSLYSPQAVWMDIVTWGEEWELVQDYKTLTPEFFEAAYAGSGSIGTVFNFFPALLITFYHNASLSKVTQAEVTGMALVNGETLHSAQEFHIPGLRMVWNALDRFGADEPDTQWIPYYRNPRNDYPEGVILSSWQRGDQCLIVLFNPQYQPVNLPDKMFAGLTDFRNALENQPIPAPPKTLEGRGFQLLQARQAK